MSAETFVDSNVLLYLVSHDGLKAARAEESLRSKPVISSQVLNEFVAVSRRKFKLTWPEVRIALAPIRQACRIVPVTVETHELAVDIAEYAGIRIYDALIAASAALAGCTVLLSEDLNAGQRIGPVIIRNPFA